MLRLVVVLLTVAFAGCEARRPGAATRDPASTPRDKVLRIAVIPKSTNHDFWNAVRTGADRAVKELDGVEIIWDGTQTDADIAGQVNLVKSFITKRVDGICLAPSHSEALVDAVVEANEEGIPVIIFDSGLGGGAKHVSFVATDNFNGGKLAAKRLAEALGEEGDVILLRYRVGSESTEQREAGFLEAVRDHPRIRLLSSDQYAEATTETAMRKALALLLKYQGEVDGIFAANESSSNGTLEALEQAGLAGNVKFVAFDPSEGLINGLRDGKVSGIVLQDPVNMGYLSVKTMVAHLRGEQVASRISTGEHVATAENMSQSPIDRLLDPL